MAEKTLKTRILVKYDTFANWVEKNPILKAGELAVATIATGSTEKVNSIDTPQVLIKVGDGVNHYTDLKMVSGLAADVYGWAKEASKPTYTASEIDGLSTYISGQIKDTDTLFKLVKVDDDGYQYKLQSKAKDTSTWTDVGESVVITIPDKTSDIQALQNLVGSVAVATQIATAISALNLDKTYATISYVDNKIDSIPSPPEYTIKKLTTATDGYLASYQLEKAGSLVGDTINIPKDYLVKSATCETCAKADSPIKGLNIGDKYLDFVINVKSGSATDEHIYVNVADLVDTYTAGDNVSINDSVISVDLSSKVDKVEGKGLIDENVANAFTYSNNEVMTSNGFSAMAGIYAENEITVAVLGENGSPVYHSLSDKANKSDLATVATSGKVTDLVQAADDVLIFDCGNATI